MARPLFSSCFIVIVSLFSCKEVSEEQKQDFLKIQQDYGNITGTGSGVYSNLKGGSGKYFEIKIKSSAYNNAQNKLTPVAIGVALRLSENFRGKEQFDRFEITLRDSLGQGNKFTIMTDSLVKFQKYQAIAKGYLKKVMAGDYAYIREKFAYYDDQLSVDSIKSSYSPMTTKDTATVDITNLRSGQRIFTRYKDKSQLKILYFVGYIDRGRDIIRYEISVDCTTPLAYITKLNFDIVAK